jgi:Tfp pilus assembly protein PilO
MPSSFDLRSAKLSRIQRSPRFWLQVGVGALAVLNLAALVLYLDPPGGSRAELSAESQQLRSAVTAAQIRTLRLKTVSQQVQLGSQQSVDFENRYILPKRLAYESVLAEEQRIAQAANLVQRDGSWTEEPIEGTADLSLLTNTANFEGSYASLMRFLYEVDRSPKLLMLDTLTATPQKAGEITAQVRFQAVIRDAENALPVPAGGRP